MKFAGIFTGFLSIFLLASTALSATFTVTKTTDSNDGTCDADCSLREAVTVANNTAGDDIVAFSGTVFGTAQIVELTLGEIVVTGANGALTINGTSAASLTVDGNASGRILTINAATVTINNITLTGGNAASTLNTGRGGAIYNFGGTTTLNNCIINQNTGANGGGLSNSASSSPAINGNLTLNNCIVSNNTATGSGGGMQNFSTSTVTINSSLFMGNMSGGSTGGGGAQFNGIVRVTNSTFASNSAPGGSGGGFQSNGSGQVFTNVTIANNTSTTNGGGIHRGSSNVNFFIRNSIVAGNNGDAASPDVTNTAGGLDSEGNNIIGTVGTSTGWETSDLLGVNPMLNPLANNGGFSMTFLPMNGSPAINAGQNCVVNLSCATNNPPVAVTTDQRGVIRPQGSAVDIGAVEVAAAVSNAMVSGRVVLTNGSGANNVIVRISNSGGNVIQTTRTSSFGYFSFTGIPTGQTYTISASGKQRTFASQQVSVNGDLTDITITGTVNSFYETKNGKF